MLLQPSRKRGRVLRQRLATAAFYWLCCLPLGSGAGTEQKASLGIEGHISPSCQIANTVPAVLLGDLSRAGSASVSFQLSCNTPFRFKLSSQYGSLRQTEGAGAHAPFFSSLQYKVTLKLGTGTSLPVDSCLSSNMIGAAALCAGQSTAGTSTIQQPASIGFSWDPHGAVPVAGRYVDIVTLTVSAGL
jgi:hypothetical protein